MIKRKQGITASMTVTMVLIIALLATTVTISVNTTLKSSKLKAFATELSTIQDTIDMYTKTTTAVDYVVNDITVAPPTDAINTQFDGETVTNGEIILHVINLSKIGIEKTVYGKSKTVTDVYAMSFETGKVYYVKGYDASDMVYYTLTEELKNLLSGNVQTVGDSSNIIFIPNHLGWTNEAIQVKVKIPQTININTVSITANVNDVSISSATLNGSYNEITVNTANYKGNYTFIVQYVLDGQNNTQEYVVSTYDSVAPVISVGEMGVVSGNLDYGYLNEVYAADLNGIKKLAYSEIKLTEEEAEEYFKTNGTIVSNNTIRISPSAQHYTIYSEDYAGNFSIKVVENTVNFDEIVANRPALKTGMIPVEWNESLNSWVKADVTNNNYSWYNYSKEERKWANVVTVKESGTKTRSYYMDEALIGDPIVEEDITAMFVWIPRYAYHINYYTSALLQTPSTDNVKTMYADFDIVFLNGTSDKATNGKTAVRSNTAAQNFVVHPAFTNDVNLGGMDKELTGFWAGKYEASNSESVVNNNGYTSATSVNLLAGGGNTTEGHVTIRPNVTSWRYVNVQKMFTLCLAMNDTNNIHGLDEFSDTMLMKNSQWGAVTYLTQSNFGNKEIGDNDSGVWNNTYNEGIIFDSTNSYGMDSYSVNLTGMVGIKEGTTNGKVTNVSYYSYAIDKIIDEANGTITISYIYRNNDGTEKAGGTYNFYKYYTEVGQKGSSTRNIYGVYDLYGGMNEIMSSYLLNGTTSYVSVFNAFSPKYVQKYNGTGNESNEAARQANYEANSNIYGDGIQETSVYGYASNSLFKALSYTPILKAPFFFRGGYFGIGAKGIFYYEGQTGINMYNMTFRVVLI